MKGRFYLHPKHQLEVFFAKELYTAKVRHCRIVHPSKSTWPNAASASFADVHRRVLGPLESPKHHPSCLDSISHLNDTTWKLVVAIV